MNQRKSLARQAGVSFFVVIFVSAFLGIAGIYGFKIGKHYFDQKSLIDIVEIKLREGRDQKQAVDDIIRRIWDSCNVNSMDIPYDAITVERTDEGKLVAEVKWAPKVPLWKGATLLLDLPIKRDLAPE